MPASQKHVTFDGLEFTAEPVTEPDPVFYTDQAPEFEITIKNNNAEYDFAEDSTFLWTIETDHQKVIYEEEVELGRLDDGEETSITVGGKVLAYEGHGVFGISTSGAKRADKDRWTLKPGKGEMTTPVYTYSVWDKSHYEASIRQPKRLQIGLLVTSIALIFFALIQIYLSF